MDTITGKANAEVLDYLLKRRSAKVTDLRAPGPDAEQLLVMLRVAARVPDHGQMSPWYFLVFEGAAREEAGEAIAAAYRKNNPDAAEDQIVRERESFVRAPVVVGLISRVRSGKKPIWEQILSAGAAGQNLSLAAHSLGFGVQWLTEWYAYDDDVRDAFGLDVRDHVAGFFYIGSFDEAPVERPRPDLENIVTRWRAGEKTLKGDAAYDNPQLGFPERGFDFKIKD